MGRLISLLLPAHKFCRIFRGNPLRPQREAPIRRTQIPITLQRIIKSIVSEIISGKIYTGFRSPLATFTFAALITLSSSHIYPDSTSSTISWGLAPSCEISSTTS